MNAFFATLGIILGLSGTPSFADETVPPSVLNNATPIETCFLPAEMAVVGRLLAHREVQTILKDRDYTETAVSFYTSIDCELYSPFYASGPSTAEVDTFLYDNESLAAVREIMITAKEAGTTPLRLWVLLAVTYYDEQVLAGEIVSYLNELEPPQ